MCFSTLEQVIPQEMNLTKTYSSLLNLLPYPLHKTNAKKTWECDFFLILYESFLYGVCFNEERRASF